MAPTKSVAQKTASNGTSQEPTSKSEEPSVNRKKQKRREKQAARLAAEQVASNVASEPQSKGQNGHTPSQNSGHERNGHQHESGSHAQEYSPSDGDENYGSRDGEDMFYSEEDSRYAGTAADLTSNTKSKKKNNKNKNRSNTEQSYQSAYSNPPMPGRFHPPPPPPPPPPLDDSAVRSAHSVSKDRIWNTSTAEERERIKEFWLSLEETQRRSLVKVEKEAVLKKMKEQQKHSCSCSVCGRKRTAIEEELEVLYDAYYEELEQYANHQQTYLADGTPVMPPQGTYSRFSRMPFPQDGERLYGQTSTGGTTQMAGSFIDDEDGDDETYSDEEESEDDYYSPQVPRGPAADFFNFGNSLTVQGGILTVADDLLKNDGKKFIEMMEQLAERRMQREEEAQYAASGLRHPSMAGNSHNQPLDDDDYEDEEDEDYASDEDDDYDEDEMETMTEEQRMEEGRRMFQIFAARMFEQRVLTAYREKVARERQEKLLEELADESRLDAQREAKKAKEAQKKKDKKKQQKAAKEEERLKREEQKAKEEAAVKAEEERKLEEQRQRKEEQRKKRDAEKKAQDEERQRKENEKQKKLQEARDQQAEAERKQRESKEKEKKKKDDAKKKEREEREAKEMEKRDRELGEKHEREARAKAERDSKERVKREESSKQPVQQVPIPIPPLLRKGTSPAVPNISPGAGPTLSSHVSPHPHVVTPNIPKAPTPIKLQQPLRQGSHHSSPKSSNVRTDSSAASPSSSQNQAIPPTSPPGIKSIPQSLSLPQQPTMPSSLPPIAPPPGMSPFPYSGMTNSPALGGSGLPSNFGGPMSGVMPRGLNNHDQSSYASQPFSAPPHRGFATPSTVGFPPGIGGIRQMPVGRGSPVDTPISQAPIGSGLNHSSMPQPSHSRQASASFENPGPPQTQPIARPNPIQRPSSIPQQDERRTEVDDLSKHLGSSALLDDTDDALGISHAESRINRAPGGQRPGRLAFGGPSMFPDSIGSSRAENFPRWGTTPHMPPYGTPTQSYQQNWAQMPPPGLTNNNNNKGTGFGVISGMGNRHVARPVELRLLVCEACRRLTAASDNQGFGPTSNLHSINVLMREVEKLRGPSEHPIQAVELMSICETEGNSQNGGGVLSIEDLGHRGPNAQGLHVRYSPEAPPFGHRTLGGHGEIGSPITGVLHFGGGGGGRGYQSGGGGSGHPGY